MNFAHSNKVLYNMEQLLLLCISTLRRSRMKIIQDNVVWLQLEDVLRIEVHYSTMPLAQALVGKALHQVGLVVAEENRADFVMVKNHKMAEFVRGLKWILDLDEVKDLSLEELMQLRTKMYEEWKQLKSYAMVEVDPLQQVDLLTESDLASYRFHQLSEFICLRLGDEPRLVLPEGVKLPRLRETNPNMVSKMLDLIVAEQDRRTASS